MATMSKKGKKILGAAKKTAPADKKKAKSVFYAKGAAKAAPSTLVS